MVTNSPKGSFVAISVGSEAIDRTSACALGEDGAVVCWGRGQAVPAPGGAFASVEISIRDYACGLRTDGNAVCWNSSDSVIGGPPAEAIFTQVSPGHYHGCGLKPDGMIICWGRNRNGQASAPAGTFAAVSSGYEHVCAL